MIRVAVALAVLAALLPTAGGTAPASSDREYIALGDSIAAGYGASSQARSFVGLHYGYLRASRQEVDRLQNVSGPGAWSRDLLDVQVPAARNLINDASDTKVITIAVGFVDQGHGCDEPGGERCRLGPNLRAALEALGQALEGDPGTEAVNVLVYPTIEGAAEVNRLLLGADGRVDCAAKGVDVGLDDILYCTAASVGATPVSVRELRQDELAADGHPNDAGHRTIAEAFGGAVELAPDPPPPAAQCIVPGVVGKRLAAARSAIARARCKTGRVTRTFARRPPGVVIRQSPQAGRKLPVRARVNLVVSRGPAP